MYLLALLLGQFAHDPETLAPELNRVRLMQLVLILFPNEPEFQQRHYFVSLR